MKKILIIPFLLITGIVFCQERFSHVEFVGDTTHILTATEADMYKSSKLSTGNYTHTGCDHGACYLRFEYKGRTTEINIGDYISYLTICEFDFGADGDKEIVIVNDFDETSLIFVYGYSRGIAQKLFEKEILYYRTVLSKDYIEFYMPSGLDQVWNYYQGSFWSMELIEFK